jgi:hypothetical protein
MTNLLCRPKVDPTARTGHWGCHTYTAGTYKAGDTGRGLRPGGRDRG